MPESVFDAFQKQMCRLAQQYPSMVLMQSPPPHAAAAGSARHPVLFSDVFRDRLIPIHPSAPHWISMAAGIASVGKLVVIVAARPNFSGRIWEEIRHVAIPAKKNITLVSLPPPNVEDRPSPLSDFALLRAIPMSEAYAPADLEETRQVVDYCVTRHITNYVRLPGHFNMEKIQAIFGEAFRFSPGVWPRLRAGDDIALIGCGNTTAMALQAAQTLASEGIQASVHHAGSVQPVDRTTVVEIARKARRIVVCEEHVGHGGLGGAVAEAVAETGVAVKLVCLGLSEHETAPSLHPADILRAARTLIPKKRT